jgi:hypothetical protein
MIAFAGALRLKNAKAASGDKRTDAFTINARWDLEMQRLTPEI